MARQAKSSPKIGWLFVGIVLLLAGAILINLYYDKEMSVRIAESINIDNGDTKINWNNYPTTDIELSTPLTISESGTYHLTGYAKDAPVIINAADDAVVRLILDNIVIKNSTAPAIICYSADDLVVETVGENILEDGKAYSDQYDEDVKGVIYSKADLTFAGDGVLRIIANYQDGIVSKDDLKFDGGTYQIKAADDGIRGKDSVYVVSGNFNIDAGGDAIKSTNETDAGKGFIAIKDGDFMIEAGDDGIHAFRQLIIEGSNIEIAQSYEGLEAQNIIINNGKISIFALDDGMNAGGGNDDQADKNPFKADSNCILTVNGGEIYINASGDGIDSNGYIYFGGGNVVVDGPTNNGNGALDSGLGITMNGGTVVAVGASGMAVDLGQESSIYNISVYFSAFQPAGTKLEIRNTSGETIISHTSAKAFNHLAAGSENFEPGEAYIIYINGEKYKEFIILDITTTVGEGENNGQPGFQPDPNMPRPNDAPERN